MNRHDILKNKWVWFAGCLILLVTLALLLFPVAGKFYLTRWLLERGADAVTIQSIRFNPFSGTAALIGTKVDQNGKTVFSDSTISVDLSLLALFKKEGFLESTRLENITIDIDRLENGQLRIGSYPLPPKGAESGKPSPSAGGSPWFFKAADIEIKDVTIRYHQPDLKGTLIINRAKIVQISTDPNDQPGSLECSASLNGSPLTLNLDRIRVAPDLALEGNVSITGFQFDSAAQLTKQWLNLLLGSVTAVGAVHLDKQPQGGLQAGFTGSLQLNSPEAAAKSWQTKGDTLRWQGRVVYADAKGLQLDIDGKLEGKRLDFTMQEPTLQVSAPEAVIDGKTRVGITDSLHFESDAAIHLAGTGVQLSGIDIQEQKAAWKGKIKYRPKDGNQKSATVTTHGILTSTGLNVKKDQGFELNQGAAEISGITDITLSTGLEIGYDGSFSLQKNQLSTEKISTVVDSLLWKGKAGYIPANKDLREITLNGTLQGKDINAKLSAPNLQLAQKDISASADCSLSIGQDYAFTGSAGLEAVEFTLDSQDQPVVQIKQGKIAKATDNGKGGLVIETIALADIAFSGSGKQPVNVEVPNITLSNITSPDLRSATVSLVEIKQPVVTKGKQQDLLASLDTISAGTISVDRQKRVTMSDLQIQKGQFLFSPGEKKPQLTLTGADAGNISWSSDQGLAIDSIEMKGLFADISKKATAKNKKQEQQAVAKNKPEQKAIPKVKINRITVNGKAGRSGAHYVDTTLQTRFEVSFDLESLEVTGIDSSLKNQPLHYDLSGNFTPHSPLTISGTATPFADNLQLKQELQLRNFPAEEISPYVTAAVGYLFESGQIRLNSTLKVDHDEIDMENRLKLEDLITKAVSKQLAEELNNQLPVPLDTALYLLRDSNGNIEINVPLKGKIADLKVGISDVLITALANAITISVTPYLAYTFLGPTGALAYLGVKAGQVLLETNFPKLEFAAGVSDLNKSQQATLDSIGKSIKDNPKDYNICARVSVREGGTDNQQAGLTQEQLLKNESVRKKLYALGELRAENVKNYLVSTGGIDKNRLLICNPGINFDKNAKGSVELKQ